MMNTLFVVVPLEEKDALMATCVDQRAECHWHTIPDEHDTALVLLVRPKTTVYLDCFSRYLSFPDLRDKQTTIGPELIAAFPASVGLTDKDTTHSALQKIHTVLGFAAMHPHR